MTREEIIALAKHHCFGCNAEGDHWHFDDDGIEAFFHAAQALEREECATECNKLYYKFIGVEYGETRYGIAACADAIRNRSASLVANHKKRIEELEAEIARMKREPRQSLAAKIRGKK